MDITQIEAASYEIDPDEELRFAPGIDWLRLAGSSPACVRGWIEDVAEEYLVYEGDVEKLFWNVVTHLSYDFGVVLYMTGQVFHYPSKTDEDWLREPLHWEFFLDVTERTVIEILER